MPTPRANQNARLEGVERAVRAATIFLGETGEFRLSVAIFGHPVRRAHWLEHITVELKKTKVQLTECRLPETGEPRLLEEVTAHLRDVPTLPGHARAVVVTGISHHLPDAATTHQPGGPIPRLLAEANLDRELFPQRCPHPLLLCVTHTADGQFRRHAPDLMQWCSHTFDFTEPALPDGSHPIRGISELESAQPGTIYANRDEMLRAAGIFRAGLDAAIAAYGCDHHETVRVRANLANVLHQLGRTPEALVMAEENLKVMEKADGIADTEITSGIGQLAFYLAALGISTKAEPLMRQVLAINEATLGKDDPVVGTNLNNLALLLKATNRLAEAEPLMRRALAIAEAAFGQNHPTVGLRLNNLAMLLKDCGRLAEAETMLYRALAIAEGNYAKDHHFVGNTLNNIATLLRDTNRLAEAEPLLRRALTISEAAFGKNHPDVANRLGNLAVLLQDTNRRTEAEPLLRRAVAVSEEYFGANHPDLARNLSNLGQLLKNTNQLAEAEPLMRRALSIDQNVFGQNHPTVAVRLGNLAMLLKDTNRPAEAEPLLRRALGIDQACFGQDHLNVAIDLNNLALVLSYTNRLEEAKPLMRHALELLVNTADATGHAHPSLNVVTENYRGLLVQMGDAPAQAQEKIDKLLEPLRSK